MLKIFVVTKYDTEGQPLIRFLVVCPVTIAIYAVS